MNTMKFAHIMTARYRAMYPTGGQTYRQALAMQLYKAHRMIRRGESLEAAVLEAKKIDRRIQGEKSVIRAAVSNGIKLGYTVSVYDGEAWAVRNSASVVEVVDAIQSTDADSIKFNKMGADGKRVSVGTIYAVYGNSAGEVLADWTDSPEFETILAPAIRRQDRYNALGI